MTCRHCHNPIPGIPSPCAPFVDTCAARSVASDDAAAVERVRVELKTGQGPTSPWDPDGTRRRAREAATLAHRAALAVAEVTGEGL